MNTSNLKKIEEFENKIKNKIEFYKKPIIFSYSYDASNIKRVPKIVVFPKNKDDVKFIIKNASNLNISLTARGGGTNLVGNALNNEVIVDFSKFNKILDIDENKRIAIVEPGVICERLNQKLKETTFPVIPSSHRVCTIGGIVNCNSAGNWSVRFGKASEWINNVWFINSYGDEICSKEIIGTEGLIGFITKVELKLTKIPNIKVSLKEYHDYIPLIEEVKKLQKNENIILLEMLDKTTCKFVLGEEKIILIIGTISNHTESANEYEEILRIREKAYPSLAREGYIIIEDPQIDLDKIVEIIDFFDKNNIPFFGHIGKGILHPCFKRDQKTLIVKMYELVKKLNGNVSGEHGIGLKKLKFASFDFINRMKKLKSEYDPNNIFNREFSELIVSS